MKTYRVTISCQTYYTDDIVADSAKEAERIANEKLCNDPNDKYRDSLDAYDDAWYVCNGEAYKVNES